MFKISFFTASNVIDILGGNEYEIINKDLSSHISTVKCAYIC